MLMKPFNVLCPDTKIVHLNKSIDTKVKLHAYNKSCIPQIDICKVIIINKGIAF